MTTATRDAIPDLFAGLDDSVEEAVSSQEGTFQAEPEHVAATETPPAGETEAGAETTTTGTPGFTSYWLNYKAAIEAAEHQVHELVQLARVADEVSDAVPGEAARLQGRPAERGILLNQHQSIRGCSHKGGRERAPEAFEREVEPRDAALVALGELPGALQVARDLEARGHQPPARKRRRKSV